MKNASENEPACLIVTAAAREFEAEIARLTDCPIPLRTSTTAEQALAEYAGETILFGNPDLIAEVLPRMPQVTWVQSTWAGVTPLINCPRRDYVLTGVKDVFGPQMSEYVFGYLLARELGVLQRRQAQDERRWMRTHSGMLKGKCLGILGTGSIGRHVARTAQAFDMTVLGLSRSGAPVVEFNKVFSIKQLYDFLAKIDYLVSALPQTPGTGHLLDARALAGLPAHAYFINVGRSNVVDHDALAGALRRGEVAGAALDVFDVEPLPADSPLWDTPNLTITAHIAAVSHPSLIAPVFIENYRRYRSGEPLNYVVDFEAGY